MRIKAGMITARCGMMPEVHIKAQIPYSTSRQRYRQTSKTHRSTTHQPQPSPQISTGIHTPHSHTQRFHQPVHTQQMLRRKRRVPRHPDKHPLIGHDPLQHLLQTRLHQLRQRRRRGRLPVRHVARMRLQERQEGRVLPPGQFMAGGGFDQQGEQRDVDGEGLAGGVEV